MCYLPNESRLGSFLNLGAFAGPISSANLQSLLVHDGDFLVQEVNQAKDLRTKQVIVSETPLLALSVLCSSAQQSKVRHWLIKEAHQKFGIEEATFSSISSMIDHFLTSNESIVQEEQILLKRLVSPRTVADELERPAQDIVVELPKPNVATVAENSSHGSIGTNELTVTENFSNDRFPDSSCTCLWPCAFSSASSGILNNNANVSDGTSSSTDVTPSMLRSLGLVSNVSSSNGLCSTPKVTESYHRDFQPAANFSKSWGSWPSAPSVRNSSSSLTENCSESTLDLQSNSNPFLSSISSLGSAVSLTSPPSEFMDKFDLRATIAQAPDLYALVQLYAAKSKEHVPSIQTMIKLAELIFKDYQQYLRQDQKNGFASNV